MTAEIAIFNREAVVLAADSAVTIGAPGSGRQKVYRSVTKIFELSRHHPVAIMVYGSSRVMGIPWEVIIGDHRNKLGDNSFDTLSEYADDFFGALGAYLSKLDDDAIEDEIDKQAEMVCNEIREEAWAYIIQRNREGGRPEAIEREFNEGLQDAVEDTKGYLEGSRPFAPISDEVMATIKRVRLERVNDELGESWMGDACTPGLRRRIHNVIQKALTRYADGYIPPRGTGVIIAGYGDAEIFPVVRSWSLTGLITPEGPLRALIQATDVEPETMKPNKSPAGIMTFAQDDMMHMFMRGIAPPLMDNVVESLDLALTTLDKRIRRSLRREAPELVDAMARPLDNAQNAAGEAFMGSFMHEQVRQFVNPVVNMLDMLPPNELAHAAEALVSLQSLRHRMTMSVESVSGPVDVVMISKGEGLVWVKRK